VGGCRNPVIVGGLDDARKHADASGLLNHQNPLLPALLSIDLEQDG
jgi:hypothetical protein